MAPTGPDFLEVCDNHGNLWESGSKHNYLVTPTVLQPGESLRLTVSRYRGEMPVTFGWKVGVTGTERWQNEPHIIIPITVNHISKSIGIYIMIKTTESHFPGYEKQVEFRYVVQG